MSIMLSTLPLSMPNGLHNQLPWPPLDNYNDGKNGNHYILLQSNTELNKCINKNMLIKINFYYNVIVTEHE